MSNDDSISNLKSLHISIDEEDEENIQMLPHDIEMNDEIDDDDYEDDDDDDEPVTLGFAEQPKHRWSLFRHLFPSKAGGFPAWLDPVNLPYGKSRVCDFCENPMQFLIQVYAPISAKESAFHRSVFVFMCPSMNCLLKDQHEQWKWGSQNVSRSVKVFRCQLPRANPFYSSEAPKHDGSDRPLGNGASLCDWCGTWKGDKVCSSCRRARYCSEKHQALHWRFGHKADCLQMISSGSSQPCPSNERAITMEMKKVGSKTLWPEHEIIHENESEFDIDESENENLSKALASTEQVSDKLKAMCDHPEVDDEEHVHDEKKSWASFQARVAKAPEQVLRYCRSETAKPLWPVSSGRLSIADIPKCSNCGGTCIFEFQILPQLLFYFGVKNEVDSLDWATIAVYTCEASCDSNVAYKEELAWVQLSSHSTFS